MIIAPGTELPAQPPYPPGTVCACPDDTTADGICENEATVLASITRSEAGVPLETKLCIPAPQYDIFTKAFWFSTCWRWACLEDAFRSPNSDEIKPYNITINGIDKYNLDRMPGGTATVEVRDFDLIVPIAVSQNPCTD